MAKKESLQYIRAQTLTAGKCNKRKLRESFPFYSLFGESKKSAVRFNWKFPDTKLVFDFVWFLLCLSADNVWMQRNFVVTNKVFFFIVYNTSPFLPIHGRKILKLSSKSFHINNFISTWSIMNKTLKIYKSFSMQVFQKCTILFLWERSHIT